MQNLTDRHNVLAAQEKQDKALLRMAYWYVTSEGGDGSELEALLEERLGV